MPRKKPISIKQRKAQLQEKRAIKRGDIPPPEPSRPRPKRPQHNRLGPPRDPNQIDKVQAARKLQSAFLKPSPSFLELSKVLASSIALTRPVPTTVRYPSILLPSSEESAEEAVSSKGLSCPKRPKWRFDQSKKEVETNEERIFQTWLDQTRLQMETWRGADLESSEENVRSGRVKSPPYFELNLEVWRQLWRVTEISAILLVLLDSRCPPLHIPPSLHTYITNLKPARQIIFVLTKSGVVGEECSQAWKEWLAKHYPGTQVVLTESYRRSAGDTERKGQGSRKKFEPHIHDDLFSSLVKALQRAHEALVTPPDAVKANSDKLKRWRPRVRSSVNWDLLLQSRLQEREVRADNSDIQSVHEDEDARLLSDDEADAVTDDSKPMQEVKAPLTIGLIGQPNVGKSSLLNALFGEHRVKASRTPGKTKHFQTLFWTPEIRLVDCPGLVLPNFVPMELQALCSILPISQIPSLPSCIGYVSSLMPLEEIFSLTHPSITHPEPAVEDKRTWRAHQSKEALKEVDSQKTWTAMDIMTAHALAKGWVTAKAGRPDVNRAGNAMLRIVAENRVRWAFWPLAVEPKQTTTKGIWIVGVDSENEPAIDNFYEDTEGESESESGSEEDENENKEAPGTDKEGSDVGEEDKEHSDAGVLKTTSRFGALALTEDDDDSTEDDAEA